jgi:hypothetical protein
MLCTLLTCAVCRDGDATSLCQPRTQRVGQVGGMSALWDAQAPCALRRCPSCSHGCGITNTGHSALTSGICIKNDSTLRTPWHVAVGHCSACLPATTTTGASRASVQSVQCMDTSMLCTPSSPCCHHVTCLIMHRMCCRAVSLLPRTDQLWYKYIHNCATHEHDYACKPHHLVTMSPV